MTQMLLQNLLLCLSNGAITEVQITTAKLTDATSNIQVFF